MAKQVHQGKFFDNVFVFLVYNDRFTLFVVLTACAVVEGSQALCVLWLKVHKLCVCCG